MTAMPVEAVPDVAHAGRRIKKRILGALTLASVVPILVLGFVVLVLVLPSLGPGERLRFGGLQVLVLFALVGMVAGGYVIWDLGRTVATMAEVVPPSYWRSSPLVRIIKTCRGRRLSRSKTARANEHTGWIFRCSRRAHSTPAATSFFPRPRPSACECTFV